MLKTTWKACHGFRRGAVRYSERCVCIQSTLYMREISSKSLCTEIICRKSQFHHEANGLENVT